MGLYAHVREEFRTNIAMWFFSGTIILLIGSLMVGGDITGNAVSNDYYRVVCIGNACIAESTLGIIGGEGIIILGIIIIVAGIVLLLRHFLVTMLQGQFNVASAASTQTSSTSPAITTPPITTSPTTITNRKAELKSPLPATKSGSTASQISNSTQKTKFCTKCGGECDPDDLFCGNCGEKRL